MAEFRVTFTVDGRRMEQTVSAAGATEARRSVQGQFAGSRVVIVHTKNLKTGCYE